MSQIGWSQDDPYLPGGIQFGLGMFGRRPQNPMIAQPLPHSMPQMPMQPTPDEAKPKGWLEGGKFRGRDALALALGAIGDAFTGRPQTSQMILQSHQQRKLQEAKLAEERRAAQAALAKESRENTEWYNRKRFEVDNRDPGEYARGLQVLGIEPGTEEYRNRMRARLDYMTRNPDQQPSLVTLPNGTAIYGTPVQIQQYLTGGLLGGTQPAAEDKLEVEMRRRGLL